MELEALLRAVRDEEDGAANRLIAGGTQPLIAYIRRQGVSSADAQDIAQEVLIIALRQLPGLERVSLRAWLFRVASNLSLAHHRQAKGRGETRLSRADDMAGPGHRLSSVLCKREQEGELRAVIQKMTTPLREVALLDLDGGDPREYARGANISISTVSSRRVRYVNWLQKHFRDK